MKTSELAILVPVLRRPHRVAPLLDSIEANTPDPWRAIFICDPGDDEEIDAVCRDSRADAPPLLVDGNYAAKINAAVRATTEPLLFLAADDLNFHPGWLEAALTRLTPPVGVVGTNDLCNKRTMSGEHSTHSLVTRDYTRRGTIDDPDKLLCEHYPHEFADDELVATAKHRGAFAHATDSIVEHLHPMAGKAPMDDLYAGMGHRMRLGRRIYARRRHLWH